MALHNKVRSLLICPDKEKGTVMKNNRVKGKVITKESAEEQMPCATKVIRLQMPSEMAKLFIGMPEGTDPDSADEEIIVGSDELTEDISGALAVRVADGFRSFILSDNVLHYDRDERRLTKVSPEPERSDRVAEAR